MLNYLCLYWNSCGSFFFPGTSSWTSASAGILCIPLMGEMGREHSDYSMILILSILCYFIERVLTMRAHSSSSEAIGERGEAQGGGGGKVPRLCHLFHGCSCGGGRRWESLGVSGREGGASPPLEGAWGRNSLLRRGGRLWRVTGIITCLPSVSPIPVGERRGDSLEGGDPPLLGEESLLPLSSCMWRRWEGGILPPQSGVRLYSNRPLRGGTGDVSHCIKSRCLSLILILYGC